ncbi:MULTISPECIES: hypothetical protein [unclassified Microcoleus]|uniref:hypothetical protein n=1 Tax=unclassified Microcoleus TaxID=2642155 RepID=UPI0025FAA641|nr:MULTISPECIES: hypothetical protein [unclassified Microcoleus]
MVHRQLVDLTSTFLPAKPSILKPKQFGKSEKTSQKRVTVSSGRGVGNYQKFGSKTPSRGEAEDGLAPN